MISKMIPHAMHKILMIWAISLWTKLIHLDCFETEQNDWEERISTEEYFLPTIQIVILVHPYNKIQYLPFSLGAIEAQNYPKDRLRVNIITERIMIDENSIDESFVQEEIDARLKLNHKTIKLLKRWTSQNGDLYNDLKLSIANTKISNQSESEYWNADHFKHLITLKNYELFDAFQSWTDWILFIDSDVVLTNQWTFYNMTQIDRSDLIVIAPMLNSFETYSNFWGAMDENTGYYVRSDDYLPILERKQKGTFSVPMVHSCVFIDLRKKASRLLNFDPNEVQQQIFSDMKIPYDDIIAFAISAASNQIDMFIDNQDVYGYLPPPITDSPPQMNDQNTRQTLIDLELESLVNGLEFPRSSSLEQYIEEDATNIDSNTLMVDQIYVINLLRRSERKRRMKKSLRKLHIQAKFFKATDGNELNDEYLNKIGIQFLDGYRDPYHQRPMTFGEIGCFLSHYRIWEEALRLNHSKIIVLEDDVRFDRNFHQQWNLIYQKFNSLPMNQYDFLYLGRKLNDGQYDKEEIVNEMFVRPRYSYWTIGYMITRRGIEKLLLANPLSRMIPIDEFLPLMYDAHPNETLTQMFGHRQDKLEALSLRHLIVSPTHYVGDPQYISDTELSDKISEKNSMPNESSKAENYDDYQADHRGQSIGVQPPPKNRIKIAQHFEL
ncbi:activating signal cointegrator 1 [Sarcoptes scabiei]|nr:activating signal cointegrator 1 [Sarcoptes scabiei]